MKSQSLLIIIGIGLIGCNLFKNNQSLGSGVAGGCELEGTCKEVVTVNANTEREYQNCLNEAKNYNGGVWEEDSTGDSVFIHNNPDTAMTCKRAFIEGNYNVFIRAIEQDTVWDKQVLDSLNCTHGFATRTFWGYRLIDGNGNSMTRPIVPDSITIDCA